MGLLKLAESINGKYVENLGGEELEFYELTRKIHLCGVVVVEEDGGTRHRIDISRSFNQLRRLDNFITKPRNFS